MTRRAPGTFFVVDRAAWQLLRSVDAATLRVYLALCNRADNEGTCWPSITTLAADTGICRTSVFTALSKLESLSLIRRTSGGPTKSNRYQVVQPTALVQPSELGSPAQRTTGSTVQRTGVVQPTGPKQEPRTRNKKRESRTRLSGVTGVFDSWWQIYPKKVAKADALKAFPKAIERIASTEKIDAQAAVVWLSQKTRAFAASPKGKAGQYCPNPATWLNGDRFNDDPQAWHETNGNGKPKSHTGYEHKEEHRANSW